MNIVHEVINYRKESTYFVLIFFIITVQLAIISGDITVYHKATKNAVYTAKHEFFPFNFDSSVGNKGHLIIANPIDGCTSTNALPKTDTDLHSIRNEVVQRSWILLVDDTECDTHYKIVQAQRQGYHRIVIYSNKSASNGALGIQEHLADLYSINVSFVGYEDGLELKKYAHSKSKAYVLIIEPDWSFMLEVEQACANLKRNWNSFLYWSQSLQSKWARKLEKFIRDVVGTIIQILILTSPLWVLIASYQKSRRGTTFEDHYDESPGFEYYQYRFDADDFDDGNDSYGDSEQLDNLDEYRSLLGVSKDASKSEIESAFRQKSAQYHPDRNRHLLNEGREKELHKRTELFKKMNHAKSKLLERF